MAKRDFDDLSKDPVVIRMLKNFKLSESAFQSNFDRARMELRFRLGGEDQWNENMLKLRKQGNRPSESYNQIPQFIHQVTNDMRMNMPQTRFVAGDDGSKEVAEIYEDRARAIQASSEGEVAYDAASDSQVSIGWGYWRYITDYENDKTWDQDIKIEWVPDVFMIYDDPNALKQDFSDRKFIIHAFDVPKDEFNATRDDDDHYSDDDLKEIGSKYPDWASEDTIRIAEYWELTEEKSMLYRNKESGSITEDKPDDLSNYDSREVRKPKVKWYKCNANEKLDERDWEGIYIPYVRVSGERQQIDGKIHYTGLISGMIAPQRMYNYWSNTATEIMGMAPLSPWIAAAGQIDPYKQIWDKANVQAFPWLPYNPIDVNGTPLPAPQRNSANADVSGALAMVQQAQNNFYTTSGIYPASLGKESNEKSGKAILARQREGDTSTFHFPDNMARALRFGGRILADLFPKIYDGSRKLRLLKEDKSNREVKVNQQFKDTDGSMKEFDMTKGQYDVMVTTGPSFTTRRQEAADAMITLAQSTNLMEVAPDIVYNNQDWPGADKIAERYKKTLPPQLTQDDKESPIPPQIQMQMQQMEQALQQMQAQLGQAEQALQDKQADIANKQADLQLKSQQMQLDAQDAQLQAQLEMEKIQLEREKLQVEVLKTEIAGAQDKMSAAQPQKQPETIEHENIPDTEGTLMAQGSLIAEKVQALRQKREEDAMKAQAHQDMMVQADAQHAQNVQMEAEKFAQDQQSREAMMGILMDLSGRVEGLTKAVTAPRVATRNADGTLQGVVVVQ